MHSDNRKRVMARMAKTSFHCRKQHQLRQASPSSSQYKRASRVCSNPTKVLVMHNSQSHPRPHQPYLLPTLARKTANSSSHWEHPRTNRYQWHSQATSRPLRYYPQDRSWALSTRLASHRHKRPLGHSMHSRWVLARKTNKFTGASLEITSRESCSVKNDRTNIRSSDR